MENIIHNTRKWAFLACCVALIASPVLADDPAPTPEDLERLAAIEAFTKKQKEADYGPKFKQAAEEFGVPVEILMGIAFAETRHEHLMWPEGERFSPENGMPRPYGIMSLWDNEFFGHSLQEAAKLIGKTPEELMKDPLQNMRGGAALLKKYYDENPKPDYAKEGSKESWKYAIVKYCGIAEPDLSHQHAFDVYDWLSQGYSQYGIELPEVPDLDLKAMWEETKKIKEEQRKINEEKWRAEGKMDDAILDSIDDSLTASSNTPSTRTIAKEEDAEKAVVKPVIAATPPSNQNWTWLAIIGFAVLIIGFLVFRKKPAPQKK